MQMTRSRYKETKSTDTNSSKGKTRRNVKWATGYMAIPT